MKEMAIYNIAALIVISASAFGLLKARKGSFGKNTKLVLEMSSVVLMAGTLLTILFLDMLALGIIGLVPN